ncbi:peptide chain release factor N(5)-glutamine methyltransferase [Alicyclobacillus herbarius]|uniref:peptide chain release factor N(5)-glutamine methyltransferase n=1 Tax=Alicyclobacillus herbarius TaxID=122960 RepID=UPI00040AB5D7|nr:peptide chain release factor N(5)-glutamine methyltransferase [Alicyclobacillus herbarius]
MTVQEALNWASFCLSRGAQSRFVDTGEAAAVARAEAEQLLLAATGWTRTQMLIRLAHPLAPSYEARLREWVAERGKGRPLQHILGQADFYGRSFSVGPECLIPRPETEVLVEQAIRWLHEHPDGRALDIGTGSGAIAVTLALECPIAEVHGLDVSPAALAWARDNARRLGATVYWHLGDAAAFLPLQAGQWNLIVSNPPYIPTREVAKLDAEVRDYEPHLALDGGEDGLDFYRLLARNAALAFQPGPAAILLEVGHDQAHAVMRLFTDVHASLWRGWRFQAIPDLRGILRVVMGER